MRTVLLTLGLLGLAQRLDAQGERPDSQRTVRLEVDSLFRAGFSGFEAPVERVLTDSTALDSAWARLFPRRHPPQSMPAVNFETSGVILLALGRRPSTGFHLFVDSVRVVGSGTEVFYREIAPGQGCVVGTAITQPVLLSRSHIRSRPCASPGRSRI